MWVWLRLCFATKQCRFEKLVLDGDEESNVGGRGGEMEIEKIQAQTIEARTTGSHPVWG